MIKYHIDYKQLGNSDQRPIEEIIVTDEDYTEESAEFITTLQFHGVETIKFFIIRHGESQANYIQNTSTSPFRKIVTLGFKTLAVEDPQLTLKGIADSEAYNNRKHQDHIPNLVFTSVLSRAQQTALLMYPSTEVFVTPFLKETYSASCEFESSYLPGSVDNFPLLSPYVQTLMRNQYLENKLKFLNFKYISEDQHQPGDLHLNPDIEFNYSDIHQKNGSLPMFFANVRKYLIDWLKDKAYFDRELKIAIVCHGNVIKCLLETFNQYTEHVNNNSIYVIRKKVDMDKHKESLSLVEFNKLVILFKAYLHRNKQPFKEKTLSFFGKKQELTPKRRILEFNLFQIDHGTDLENHENIQRKLEYLKLQPYYAPPLPFRFPSPSAPPLPDIPPLPEIPALSGVPSEPSP